MIHSIRNLGFFEDHKIELNSVVDLGAHHGEVAIYFAQSNPSARILAVEGSSQSFAILKENVERQNLLSNNIILVNEAISDRAGVVDMTLDRGGENTIVLDEKKRWRYHPWLKPFRKENLRTEKVKSDTLSNLLKRYNFDYVDFMKVDIEGVEPLLYESLEKDSSIIKSIFIELGSLKTLDGDHRLMGLLFRKDFKCFDLWGTELKSLDVAKEYLYKGWINKESIPNLWFLQGKHSKKSYHSSFKSLERQIEEDPNNTLAWYNLNQILRDKGEFDKAVENGIRALSFKPYEEDRKTYLMLLFNTAYCCLMSGHLDEGERLCQEGLTYNPQSLNLLSFLSVLGGIYFNKKRYNDAISTYQEFLKQREIIEKDPNFKAYVMDTRSRKSAIRATIGECYRLLGDYQKAIDYLKNAITQDDQHLDLYKNLALCYILMGELPGARCTLERAVEVGIADDRTFVKLGDLYIREKRLDEAIKQYEEALEINPDNSDAYNGRGYALLMKGQKEDADLKFSKALELNPNHERACFNFVKLKFSQGAHQETLEQIDKLVSLEPQSAEIYREAGNICVQLGKYEKAIDLYEECIIQDPTDKVTMSNVASCYAKLGHLESAQMAYQTVLSIDPNYAEATRSLKVVEDLITKYGIGEQSMVDAAL